MRLIERYLLRQLLTSTLLATGALAVVAMLSATLGNLDVLGQGQSPFLLIQISILAMPQLLSLISPIAVFVAALMALNRLHTEQEIVVCFASGMSTWRVISPAIRLASGVALAALVLNLWVAPLADRAMRDELFHIRTDLASSMIRVGAFNQPSPGLTVYAQDVDQGGSYRNMFLLQEKSDGGDTTFIAGRGKMAKRNGQPVLILRDGSSQEFSRAGVLNFVKFGEYTLDLRGFLATKNTFRYKIADRYLHELLFPDLSQSWERKNRKAMLAEAHNRLSAPLYDIAFMAMALAAVIAGPFSRLGYGRQIIMAGSGAAVVRLLGFGATAAAAGAPLLNILQYLIPLAAALWAFGQLFRWPIQGFLALAPAQRRRLPAGAAA
ncbi:MAG: LptF/LptG family permease [Caulobacteraceae bacterium]|nr:LptF/LptG family permease [Caulobacteraceae bacterium]